LVSLSVILPAASMASSWSDEVITGYCEGEETLKVNWTATACHVGVYVARGSGPIRSEEHTSELQSRFDLVCRLLLEKKKIQRSYARLLLRDIIALRERRPALDRPRRLHICVPPGLVGERHRVGAGRQYRPHYASAHE